MNMWFLLTEVLVFLLVCSEGLNASPRCKPLNKQKTKLVIDHDGGADDAMAIFMSLLYEQYFNGPEVVALTVVNGNVNETQAFKNTQRILDKANRRDIKIYRGATKSLVKTMPSDNFFGVDGLGDLDYVHYQGIAAEKENAVFALIELSKKYKGNLVLMALGALTNVALAKRIDPEFIGRLKHLYVGAGNIYSEMDPLPEFNADMDVEAYRIVVEATKADKVTIVPFSEVYKTLNISKEWRSDVLGAIDTEKMKALNQYERVSFPSDNSWVMLDPVVAAVVLDEAVVEEFKYSYNSIILHGEKRGINTNDFDSENPNVRLVFSSKEDYYKQLLIDIFSAELK